MFATIMFLAQDHCNTNFHHIISHLCFEIWKVLLYWESQEVYPLHFHKVVKVDSIS